jgi:hypothetical protein
MFTPIGAAIGAGIGALVGGIGGAIATEAAGASNRVESEALKKIVNYVDEHGNSLFASEKAFKDILKEDLDIDDQELIDSLWTNRDALQELTAVELARLTEE